MKQANEKKNLDYVSKRSNREYWTDKNKQNKIVQFSCSNETRVR